MSISNAVWIVTACWVFLKLQGAIRELIHLPPGVIVWRSARPCPCNLRQTQTMGSAQVKKEWSESHPFLQNMRAVSVLEMCSDTCTRKLSSSAAWSTALPAPFLSYLVCSSICWDSDRTNKRGWGGWDHHGQMSPFVAAFHSYDHCFCGIVLTWHPDLARTMFLKKFFPVPAAMLCNSLLPPGVLEDSRSHQVFPMKENSLVGLLAV